MATTTYPLVRWLDEQLRERGWLEADLARRMDIHPNMVNRWMQGARPAPHNCRRIAEALGVDPVFVMKLAAGVTDDLNDPVKVELKAMIDATDLTSDDRAESLRTLLRSWADKDRRSACR